MVVPIPPAAMKMLLTSFGKEALGNPKTAANVAKGMSGMANAVSGGLNESLNDLKELTESLDAKGPALSLLLANFQKDTMTAQMNLMNALMELAQSEGVKLTTNAITSIVNTVTDGITDFAQFTTKISNLVGDIATSSPHWERVATAFNGLQAQSASTLKTALNSLMNTIETIGTNPLTLKLVDQMFSSVELGLKKVTVAMTVIDLLLQKIDEKLSKIFPWMNIDTSSAPEGYEIVQMPLQEGETSATETTAENILQTILGMITGGGTIWLDIIANKVKERIQEQQQETTQIQQPNRGYQL
jgi:hypothetical protein